MQKLVTQLFVLVFLLFTFPLLAFQDADLNSILSSGGSKEDKVSKINTLSVNLIEAKKMNEAENAIQKAYELVNESGNELGKAKAFDNFGLLAQSRFDYTNAMNYFVRSIKIKDALGNKTEIAATKNHIGKVFFLQRNEENAMTNFQSALTLLKQTPEDLLISAEIHRNMGDLFLAQKVIGKAKEEYDFALTIWAEQAQDLKKAATMASYLGQVVSKIGDNDGAMTYFNASLNFHRNLNDVAGIANDHLSLAKIYIAMADTEATQENIESALAAYEQTNNQFGMADAYALYGKVALKANNRTQAESYFEKSGELLKAVKVQPGVPEIFNAISESYSEMGNFPKAYTYSQAYAQSKDNLFNVQKAASLLELTTKYESEYAVKEKNRQLATLEKEKKTEMMVRWLFIALFASALVALYFIFKNYRQKKKDNDALTELNAKVQSQNDEIARKNIEMNVANQELQDKNGKLDYLNAQLVHEISERENSQRSLFSKDHYLANIAVRMRDPLNNIVTLAQTLMHEKPRKDQHDHIQNLQFAGNNLLVLINDVLDFSEIEASKISLESVDFRPEDVIQELKKEIKTSKSVRFDCTFDSRIPSEIKGDPGRMTQVLTYILKNLKQDMNEGDINLNVLRNELIDNELTLKIDIHSLGYTGNYEALDAIFNKPYNREGFENLKEGEVEFMIARRLIELQNGTVSVTKANNETIITLFLPFKVVNENDVVENTEGYVPAYNDNFLEGKRILVVEDNKVNQMLVVNMLKKKGVFVTAANDGIEGLEALNKNEIDLILMDIQMPRMDGYHAVAEIRRMKDTTKSTLPIIALTASAYVTEKEKAQLFGMTDHIGKPFSPEELLEKVTRVLMSHKANTDDTIMPQASVAVK
jgi:CheY-like chemotaxis protein